MLLKWQKAFLSNSENAFMRKHTFFPLVGSFVTTAKVYNRSWRVMWSVMQKKSSIHIISVGFVEKKKEKIET